MESRDSIFAEVDLLILPYAEPPRTVIGLLIEEFTSGQWNSFQSAVAFASQSGNFPDLIAAILDFAKAGNRIEMTFGADTFSGEGGSELEAIKQLLEALDAFPNAKISLYREKGRTFHPKMYLFAHVELRKARLLIGSSNWGGGGFYGNIEANVVINLLFDRPGHYEFFQRVSGLFTTFWQELS